MKFETVGNPDKRKVLFIHAMFMDARSFSSLVEYLKDDYFIIIPTLDGHDIENDSTFLSIYDEADKIINYLNYSGIKKLDFILGTSLGAIIALEVYGRNEIEIDKVYLDGGPFFVFGPLLKTFLSKKFWNICIRIRQNPDAAVKKINEFFPGIGNIMLDICSHMKKESMKNLSYACFTYKLPKINEEEQKSIAFMYGTKETARKCIFRLKRYKYSRIVRRHGYDHCGYLLLHPKEYAQMLRKPISAS